MHSTTTTTTCKDDDDNDVKRKLSYYVGRDYSGKCNVTLWRPSVCPPVCLSRRHTYHDSPGGSMRRGQAYISGRQ